MKVRAHGRFFPSPYFSYMARMFGDIFREAVVSIIISDYCHASRGSSKGLDATQR